MVGDRQNLVYSPGPGLWSLVLGPLGPDLGPDLDLTWDLDLDLSLTISSSGTCLNTFAFCYTPDADWGNVLVSVRKYAINVYMFIKCFG